MLDGLRACRTCIIFHPTKATHKQPPSFIVNREILQLTTTTNEVEAKVDAHIHPLTHTYIQTHLFEVRFLLLGLGVTTFAGVAAELQREL